MHACRDTHETAFSWGNEAERGIAGVGRRDQACPFQPSAKRLCVPSALDAVISPTAMHPVAEKHDTSWAAMSLVWGGLGRCCNDQRTPFQRSICPSTTAMHTLGELHDTAQASSCDLGILSTDQVNPSQRSASARVSDPPTAIHHGCDRHETASSNTGPCRAGGIIVQREPSHRSATEPC
jgi:hypothetical protein